jgi:hypothetical protein
MYNFKMAELLTFCGVDKNNKCVKFPAYGWPHAEAIASVRGYKDIGVLIAEIGLKMKKYGSEKL